MIQPNAMFDLALEKLRTVTTLNDVPITRVHTTDQIRALLQAPPAIVFLWAGGTARDNRRTGVQQQDEDWVWEVTVIGRDPDDDSTGLDVFTLLWTIKTALVGFMPAGGLGCMWSLVMPAKCTGVHPLCLSYRQTWTHWVRSV